MQHRSQRRTTPSAYAGGWVLLGLLNVFAIELLGASDSAFSVRFARHGFDVGRHLAVGAVVLALAWAWRRFAPRSRVVDMLALWCVATLVGSVLLPEDLSGLANRVGEDVGLPQSVMIVLAVMGTAASIPAATLVGRALGRGWWRLGVGVSVCGGIGLNGVVAPYDNPGMHFFVSWILAQLVAHSLDDVCGRLRHATSGRFVRLGSTGGLAAALAWAIGAVVIRPANAVVLEIGRWHGSLLASHFARLQPDDDVNSVEDEEPAARENSFFADRSNVDPLEPSTPSIMGEDGIVVFITIDALRFDLLADPRYEEYVPTLDALRQKGTSFHAARAPGSQTVYTMSAMSTGRHFSQRYWTEFSGDLWPHEDESVHFAELLTQGGVRCVLVPGARWMAEPYGLLRGFEGSDTVTGRGWVHGTKLTDGIIEVLRSGHAGPMLIYAHYFDSHAPYNRGGTDCERFECYLREIQWVDHEVSRVVDAIEEFGLGTRVLFIVSSDHGEAFGEHASKLHASTLYDELLRVPLIFVGRKVETREVDDLVSLIDIGPTMLDLFGVSTPGQFMGQSLVPFLRGESPILERPIVAEGRLKQAMVFTDNMKVIRDARSRTTEIYDLEEDPSELDDRSEEIDLASSEHVQRMRQFFGVHTLRRPGYETPYRK